VTPYVWLSLFPEKIKKFQGKEEKNGTSMPALDGSLSIFCLPFIISLHFNKPGKIGDKDILFTVSMPPRFLLYFSICKTNKFFN